MVEKRDETVYVYDFDQAKDIYEFIKSDELFSAIEDVYKELKEKNNYLAK
jgi:hypothetical protein